MSTGAIESLRRAAVTQRWIWVVRGSLLWLGLMTAYSANAEVIVDQPLNANVFLYSQDATDLVGLSNYAFDDFTTAIPYSLTTLTAFGFTNPSGYADTTDVIAQIWSDLPGSFGGTMMLSVSGAPVGENLVFDFGGQYLPAGSYWVTTYLEQPGAQIPWLWGTHVPISGSELYFDNPGGGFGWGTDPVPYGATPNSFGSFDAAFRLEGVAVPEPTTFALAALGLTGLALAIRRKTRISISANVRP